MAEQLSPQEEQSQQPVFDSLPPAGPEPKSNQMFSAMDKIRTTKEVKSAPAKEPKQEPVPSAKKQEPIQFFETPAQKIEKQVKEEMLKEPENLSWLSSSFDNLKSQDTRYSDFTSENRMKIQPYRDAFQNKNSEIKRHQKLIGSIVANTTEDADIKELVQEDLSGNKFLNKEKLRRIVTDRVQKLGGNNIVADYVFSKAAVAAEDKFQLNNQKTVFDNKLKTANIKKPKDSDLVEKEFKDIQLKARGEMKNAQETLNMDFISEANKINDKYAYSVNQVLASAPYPMNNAIEDARNQLTSEKIDSTGQYQYFETQVPEISDEEVKQRANELFQSNNEDYLTTQYLPLLGQMQNEIKLTSSKYNNILKRKKSEIQASYERSFSQMKAMNEKEAKDYNDSIEKLWQQSGVELQNDYENKMKSTYDNMGIGENFGRKFVSAAGGMLSGIGAHLRANGITGTSVDFLSGLGQYAKMYNNTYKPSIKDAYLSPKFWAGGIGEMLGSSSVIAATTIATRNPFIGGIISNLAEGSSMAGAAYDNQLMKGKDPIEASNSASGVLRMNMLTMPLNALQAKLFMPFTKGAGFTGAFKKTTLGALGGTIEEMGQATFEEGEGFKPKMLYAPQTLEMGLEVFGSQFLMGAPGGAMSGLADNINKNKKIPSPIAQVGARMVRDNGPSRIDAISEGLNISGDIDEQQTIRMKEVSASVLSIEAEASSLGIEGDKKDAYIGLSYDISELERKKESTPSESGKSIIDRQISEKKQQITDILDDKVELASVTIAGAKIVAPVEEISKLMDTEDFANSYKDGDVKVETKNTDLLAKEEQIKSASIAQEVSTEQQAAMSPEAVDAAIQSENNNIATIQGKIEVAKQQNQPTVELESQLKSAQDNLNQLKSQQDATQISEGQQQEIPQPSNIVQREGTQEGQPQVWQAEGGIGQATQPTADNRNSNFGSQAQQVIEEIKAIPELSPVVQTYTSSVNPGQEVQLMDELAQQVTEGEERSVRQMGQAVVDKVKQWIADTGYTEPVMAVSSQEALKDVDSTTKALSPLVKELNKSNLNLPKSVGNNLFEFNQILDKLEGELPNIKNIKTFKDYVNFFIKKVVRNKDTAGLLELYKQKTGNFGGVDNIYNKYTKTVIAKTIEPLFSDYVRNAIDDEFIAKYTLAFDVVHPITGITLAKAGDIITKEFFDKINTEGDGLIDQFDVLDDGISMDTPISNNDLFELSANIGDIIKESRSQIAANISEAYHKAKADGSNPELVSAVENLLGQQTPAPAMEAAPVEDIMTLDTKDETNLQKVYNWLDNIDKQLDKFGKETAGVNILLPVAKTILKAVKALVQGGMTLQDAIKRAAADNNVSEQDVMDSLKSAETASRVYSNEQVQGVITIANEAAANIKKTEKSSLKAYQQVFSTVQKAVQNLYDTGIVPDFASARVMAEVTQSIARDAVNAAYTSTKKISAQEVESVTMSTRKYIADLMARQAKGAAQAFDKAKAVRKAVTDVFKAKNKQYGNKIQLSISDFNSLLKQMEDSVFRAPLTEEAINDAAAKATSIIEDAYNKKMNADMAAFEKQARPKIKELVDRFIQSEARKFDSVDAAAYSAFSKAMAYMEENKKEFGIKDREGDNVLSQEMDRAINELKQQKRDVEAAENVNQIFATPQGREIAAFAEAKAQEIAKSNKGKKIGKTTPTQAYKNIVTELVKMINGMYARGNYPAGIPSITMVKAAYGVAQDAVNAAFPRAEKISPQEAQMVNMSMREYMRNLATSQINAIGKVKDRAKAIRTAVGKIIDALKENFGADFKMSSAAFKQLNKNLFDAVFSKMDDATAIDDIISRVTPIVEYAMRRSLLSNTAKLLDKVRSNYKLGRYSGAARLSIMENLLNADASKWLNSNATLEDIDMFNQYLKELTGKAVNTNNLDAAVALSNNFVPTPAQSATTGKDSLNNKIKDLIRKATNNQINFNDYASLVSLEKAISDIQQKQGELTGLTQQEQDEIVQNYNDLISSLPKPIDQLLADAQAEIDADVKGKVNSLNTAIQTSQEFRDSIKNPFLYEAVLKFGKEMTDDFINSLTPKEKMLLSANIDEILRGNPNSTTYEFSAKAGAFSQSKTNYNIAKKISTKRQVINNSGITGFFGKVRRLFMDIDYNRASAERMAASFDLFKFHMMDVELNTGVDEFDMGDLEKKIFAPLARAIDSAFNKVTDSLGTMQEAMKLLNDKSNKDAIKKGIGVLNKELGTGFFGGKAKWMHVKKLLGYGNTFYMEISTRMATIVATQIDHISNLEEGESIKDVVLLRNILEQKPDDYDGRTMKEHYQTNPSAITDKTDDASLFDHIAYGILTKGGVNKLSDLSKEELLALLTESQKQAISKWREHIDNTRNVVEAAMIMRGGVTAFLNEYFPRRVFSKEGVTDIKNIEEYLAQAGGNVGVDSGQLKSRTGEVGRLDLNGNSVLYNNLKDIYLIHEVKPVLDSIKGLDNAVENLKKEKDLAAATYAEAVSIAVANRVKNSLESNERISNDNYSFWYKSASQVSSIAARVILISQIRAVADFLSNITKLSASIAFANKTLKNQIVKSVTPGITSYTTDKGTFKWDDYVKVALATGSSVHRMMSNYADNFLYEFSKPKEQLQREQRVGSWQDMAVKKAGWMNRFESAFNRITGESFDHKAFADERGAYRAMYLDSVQRASDAADSYIDRQYGLASIARQPIRVNIFAPFLGRASRNLFGKSPTIAKNNPASVILGFLTGYPSTQFQLFSRYIRRALSVDREVSAKTRAEDIAKAMTEVIVPSIMYNTIRATTGILFTTTAAAVMAAGDDEEDRKKLYKEMGSMPFWKRWLTKTRIVFGEKEEKLRNAVINGMLSSAVDPNVNALVRPVAGLLLFKMWKENVIEDMMTQGKTKSEIQEAKQKIKERENTLFEAYNIRPIELFGTSQYAQSIKINYGAQAQLEGVEDVIKSTSGFGILYNEVSRSMDLVKMINATDENEGLSETELYVASALKLGGVTFANIILSGKAGAALSMLSGDMNKLANMMISDQKSIQKGFEIEEKKRKKGRSKKSGRGTRGGGTRGGGTRGSGTR